MRELDAWSDQYTLENYPRKEDILEALSEVHQDTEQYLATLKEEDLLMQITAPGEKFSPLAGSSGMSSSMRSTIRRAAPARMPDGVRAQVRLIMNRIDRELEQGHLDTKALRDLGDTLARFEAMEQKLSMRAGPGSLKPTAKPAARRSAVTVDDDPRPVEAPAAKPAAQIPQEDPPAPAAPTTPPSPDPAPAQSLDAPAIGLDGLPTIEMPV